MGKSAPASLQEGIEILSVNELNKFSPVEDATSPQSLDLSPFLNEKGRIRLARVRWEFLQKYDSPALDELKQVFRAWSNQAEGIVLWREDQNHEKQYLALKLSKRGNDLYAYRLKQRLRSLLDIADKNDVQFFSPDERHPKTPCLFITFTYDTKRCSLSKAWENVGKEYNRALSFLKRRYGQLSVFRVWEAFENGYPHIHAIIFFKDHKFKVFRDGTYYRVQEKADLEGCWHSFIDVTGVQSLGREIRYLVKYLTKEHDSFERESKHDLTLGLMWLFKKRSFSLSGDFLKTVRLDTINAQFKQGQSDLEGNLIEETWQILGFYSWQVILDHRINPKSNLWSYHLSGDPAK